MVIEPTVDDDSDREMLNSDDEGLVLSEQSESDDSDSNDNEMDGNMASNVGNSSSRTPRSEPTFVPTEELNAYMASTRSQSSNAVENGCLPIFYEPVDGGSQVPGDVKSVLDFFSLFWTSAILAVFVEATNAYAKDTHDAAFTQDLTARELTKFFGLVLLLGIFRCSERRLYWSPSSWYYNKFIASTMSRD